jgi:ribonuclease HII
MSSAVAQLTVRPELLLIDGNRFRTKLEISYVCIVGGDGLYASIAAASVLAKTHRDEYMERLAAEFPEYGWLKNKGYPTQEHRDAIVRHGLSPHHRKTFRNGAGQQTLF